MLDAFKNMSGAKGKAAADKQTTELEQLIATAREERTALNAALASLTTRSAKIQPLTQSMEQAVNFSSSVASKLDAITARLDKLDGRTKELEGLDERILALKTTALQAEQTTQKTVGPDGELQKHREAVLQLSSQALQTRSTLEALKKEQAALAEVRAEMRGAHEEVKAAVAQSLVLKGEFEQIRTTSSLLLQDYATLRDSSRDAREHANAAMTVAKNIDTKLAALADLQELSRTTEQRLDALNALAEHVSRKGKVIESQQQAVEHAVVQANRVNEIVWAMEIQIGKLNESMKHAVRSEETVGRIEKLTQETSVQLDAATRTQEQVQRDSDRLLKDIVALSESVHGQVDTLAVRRKEFETFDERVRSLVTSVDDAEARMDRLVAKDKSLLDQAQKLQLLTKRLDALSTQSDELAQKQQSLESLHERLLQVDELAKKTSWQLDGVRQSQSDVEVARKEVQEFYKSHADLVLLRDKLGADRTALEAFGERMAILFQQAPEIESKMDALLAKTSLAEDAAQKATRLSESVAVLDAQVSRVGARAESVTTLEGRLDALNTVSQEVSRRLESQLARRAELDALQSACDGLGGEMVDIQHKLETIRSVQQRVGPMESHVDQLTSAVELAHGRLSAMKLDQATVAEQERRFQELLATSRSISADVTERARQMQSIAESMAQSNEMKSELLAELERAHGRQREAAAQVQATEDQLVRAESILKQLEQRRMQLTFGEKKLAAFEARLVDVKQVADDLDRNFQVIIGRDQVVSAVKAEVQTIHEIGARTKADLAEVTDHRAEIAVVKTLVDELLLRIDETEERLGAIDARRRVVDEVHSKTTAVVHMLDDVRINLETLGEHKAVIDHVADHVQQLEFTLQEARNTLHTLQHERELAERIERGIAQLRATGKGEEPVRTASA